MSPTNLHVCTVCAGTLQLIYCLMAFSATNYEVGLSTLNKYYSNLSFVIAIKSS